MRNDPTVIRRLLTMPGTWAVVGLSANTDRAAYRVSHLVQQLGHRIIPVHPRVQLVHGAAGVKTLADIDVRVDVVDIFVNSAHAGTVVDQAISIGAGAVWLQLGVVDEEAAQRAEKAGLEVVMDRCPAIEAEALALLTSENPDMS